MAWLGAVGPSRRAARPNSDFRSSSGRCAHFRRLAERDPDVLKSPQISEVLPLLYTNGLVRRRLHTGAGAVLRATGSVPRRGSGTAVPGPAAAQSFSPRIELIRCIITITFTSEDPVPRKPGEAVGNT
jgi:hypothetical protein